MRFEGKLADRLAGEWSRTTRPLAAAHRTQRSPRESRPRRCL